MRPIIITHTIFRDRKIMLMQNSLTSSTRRTINLISFSIQLNFTKLCQTKTLSNVVDVDIVFDRNFGHILYRHLGDLRSGGLCLWVYLSWLLSFCQQTVCVHSFELSPFLCLDEFTLSSVSLWLFLGTNRSNFRFFFGLLVIFSFFAVVAAPKES